MDLHLSSALMLKRHFLLALLLHFPSSSALGPSGIKRVTHHHQTLLQISILF
jgi:hypothetical protein